MSHYVRDQHLISMHDQIKNLTILSSRAFLEEVIKAVPKLFDKSGEEIRCSLFTIGLLGLENAIPSFTSNHELKGIALLYRDKPWYLILALEHCVKQNWVKWKDL